MKKQSALFVLVIVLAAGQIFQWFYMNRKEHKIGFVDTLKVFDSYKLKAEMERESDKKLKPIKEQIDSLSVLLKLEQKGNQGNSGRQNLLMEQITDQRELFTRTYDQENERVNKAVWARLNSLMTDFGKESGVKLLIGANGMGTVLYGDEAMDYTNDLIKFVNSKYE